MYTIWLILGIRIYAYRATPTNKLEVTWRSGFGSMGSLLHIYKHIVKGTSNIVYNKTPDKPFCQIRRFSDTWFSTQFDEFPGWLFFY